MRTLHLLGQEDDTGGVLSVLRYLQEVLPAGDTQAVWVHQSFRQTRTPALDLRACPHALGESHDHLRLLARAMRSFLRLKHLLAREPFDILHAHTRGMYLLGLLANRVLRRPVLYTSHAYARNTRLYRASRSLSQWYLSVLTPNMARHYGLAPHPPRVSIVSECCGTALFEQALLPPPTPHHPERPLQLLGLGSLTRWKQWDLLLRAVALLRPESRQQIRLTIRGPNLADPDSVRFAEELHRLAAQPQLQGIVSLKPPTSEIVNEIQAADVFVLPSTNEPCSVALIEALALGRPAVVSASGGNIDIISEGVSGMLFSPGDAAHLTSRLESLLQRGGQLGTPQAIRETVRQRSAPRVLESYRRIYEAMLRGH